MSVFRESEMIHLYVFKRFSPSRLLYPTSGVSLVEMEFNNIISRGAFQRDFNPIRSSDEPPIGSIAEYKREPNVESYILSLK